VLAGVFLVTGPSESAARALAAVCMLAAVLLVGWLGYLRTGRASVGVAAPVVAGFSPWLFELGRLAFEIAIAPLFLCLALLGLSPLHVVGHGVWNYLQDLQLWHYVVSGDSKPYAHTPGTSALLLASVVLAVAGLVIIIRRHRSDPFWRFATAALVVSPVPAALTIDRFHAVRLAPFALMLAVVAIPAIDATIRSPGLAAILVAAGAAQFALFVHDWTTDGPRRTGRFEAGIPDLLDRAWANGGTVYIDYDDREPQGLARWYALVKGIDESRVVRLPDGGVPPTGAISFGREQPCDYVCIPIARSGDYWIARVKGPPA
jgi:hypothetical protein